MQTSFKLPLWAVDVAYIPAGCESQPPHVRHRRILGSQPDYQKTTHHGYNVQGRGSVVQCDEPVIPVMLYVHIECDSCLQIREETFFRAATVGRIPPRIGQPEFSIRAALGRPPILPDDVKHGVVVAKHPSNIFPYDARSAQYQIPSNPAPVYSGHLVPQQVPINADIAGLGNSAQNLYVANLNSVAQQQVPTNLVVTDRNHPAQQQTINGPRDFAQQQVPSYADITARRNVAPRPSGISNKTPSKLNPSAEVFAPRLPQEPCVRLPPKSFVPPTTPVTFPREPVTKAVPKENNFGTKKRVSFGENTTYPYFIEGGRAQKEVRRDIDGYW